MVPQALNLEPLDIESDALRTLSHHAPNVIVENFEYCE